MLGVNLITAYRLIDVLGPPQELVALRIEVMTRGVAELSSSMSGPASRSIAIFTSISPGDSALYDFNTTSICLSSYFSTLRLFSFGAR